MAQCPERRRACRQMRAQSGSPFDAHRPAFLLSSIHACSWSGCLCYLWGCEQHPPGAPPAPPTALAKQLVQQLRRPLPTHILQRIHHLPCPEIPAHILMTKHLANQVAACCVSNATAHCPLGSCAAAAPLPALPLPEAKVGGRMG